MDFLQQKSQTSFQLRFKEPVLMSKEVINDLWVLYSHVMFHLLFYFNPLACFLIHEKLMLRLFYKDYTHFEGCYSRKHILKLRVQYLQI